MSGGDWRILHLTDFHIHDPDLVGGTEHLRKAFYDEYLLGLCSQVQRPDVIVVTGDFVNKGRVRNFGHAAAVIKHAAEHFGLTLRNVAVCPGNHDLDRDLERASEYEAARRGYHSFSSTFANGDPIERTDRAVLCAPTERIRCLMIDCMLGATGDEVPGPGPLSDAERDEIMHWVKQIRSPQELLVVGTHYSPEEPANNPAPDEEPNWHSRHIWSAGKALKGRIGEYRRRLALQR